MSEEAVQVPPAPEAEPEISAEEHVENLFNAWNKRTSSSSTNPSDLSAGGEATASPSEPAPAEPAPPPEPVVDWQKRYNDLQSDMDRRVNRGKQELETAFNAKLDALMNVVSRALPQQQQQQPQSFGEVVNDERALQSYLDQVIGTQVNNRLANHPAVIAGNAVNELARFQMEFPDHKNYIAIMEPALKKFPAGAGQSHYDRLVQAYEYAKELLEAATASAKAQGGAVGANASPTTPQSKTPVNAKATGQQVAELKARANQYANETGISASASTKPNIDPYDPRKLRQNLEAIARKAMGQ